MMFIEDRNSYIVSKIERSFLSLHMKDMALSHNVP